VRLVLAHQGAGVRDRGQREVDRRVMRLGSGCPKTTRWKMSPPNPAAPSALRTDLQAGRLAGTDGDHEREPFSKTGRLTASAVLHGCWRAWPDWLYCLFSPSGCTVDVRETHSRRGCPATTPWIPNSSRHALPAVPDHQTHYAGSAGAPQPRPDIGASHPRVECERLRLGTCRPMPKSVLRPR
jgi:hypothetical protein